MIQARGTPLTWSRIKSGMIWRYKRLTFRPYVIDRKCAGECFKFLIGDLFGKGWYGPEHDPWPELEWIRIHGIQPGDIVIDCGANHGFSTTLFAKWAGSAGRVFAYEPLRHNVEILQQNIRMNGLANVVCRRVAAGCSSGMLKITNHPNAAVIRDTKTNQRTEVVSVIRLDDEPFPGPVAFIKIDVEGYELEVLMGAQRILESKPRLAIELHVCMYRDKVETLEQILSLLSLNRYSVDIQREVDGPIEPLDGSHDIVESLARHHVAHIFCR